MKPKKLKRLNCILLVALTFSPMFAIGYSCRPDVIFGVGTAKVRHQIMKIVKHIAKGGGLEGEYVGYVGHESVQWARYKDLCNKATNQELRALTTYANPVVRCYSFQGLAEKKDSAILSIVANHIDDTAKVHIINYDVVKIEMVGDYFIKVASGNPKGSLASLLSPAEKQQIDSLLLYGKAIKLYAKYAMFLRLTPLPNFYNKVREIAISGHNPMSLLTLARYKNLNDTSVIARYLEKPANEYYEYCSLWAVREFPNPEFYKILVQLFKEEWGKDKFEWILYQALVQYPTSETVSLLERTIGILLERTIGIPDGYEKQRLEEKLLLVITKYPNPIFDELKNKIKLDKYHQENLKLDLQRGDEELFEYL